MTFFFSKQTLFFNLLVYLYESNHKLMSEIT